MERPSDLGNAMNMGVTLAVYATICRETGRPFLFPGSAAQWNGLTDMTDARLLARHQEWAATTDAARNQAFNVVNGDVFRWSWMWMRLAGWIATGVLSGRRSSARASALRCRSDLGRDRPQASLGSERSLAGHLGMAHRRRFGPSDRGGHRYE
jgi:hypothetical protein